MTIISVTSHNLNGSIGINPSERNPDSDDKESPTVALFLQACRLSKKKKKKLNSALKTKIVI